MVGLGGVTAEGPRRCPPHGPGAEPRSIVAEIRKLKGAPLLHGFRGAAPCDVQTLAATIALLGDLMVANPKISVIEINPLVVHATGKASARSTR